MLVLAMLPLMQSCAAPPAVPSACLWLSTYYPEAGFETRWTHGEKLWLVEHNDKVTMACAPKP